MNVGGEVKGWWLGGCALAWQDVVDRASLT